MVKFPEADARKFKGVFVCRRCKAKIKTSNVKVREEKVNCRSCGSSVFRPVRKK